MSTAIQKANENNSVNTKQKSKKKFCKKKKKLTNNQVNKIKNMHSKKNWEERKSWLRKKKKDYYFEYRFL